MPKQPVRPTTHPWAVLQSLGLLYRLMNEGYIALRESPHTEAATDRERAVTYFILHGIVEALGQVREALTLLGEIEPCLADVSAPFVEDLDKWTLFRDDSAHVIDRTHRVSRNNQNDAVVREDEYGYDADTVTYDWDTDTVRTGNSDTLLLRPAINRVEAIFCHAYRRIQDALGEGLIKRPIRFREKGQ